MDVNPGRVLLVLAAAIVALFGFWSAVPATATPYLEQHTPTTTQEMQMTSADIDNRVVVGNKIFTIRSNFYAFSERDHAYTSRIWNLVSPYSGQKLHYNQTPRYDDVRDGLARKFQSGEVSLVIMTPRTSYLIQKWEPVHTAFRDHFCRVVPRPRLYDRFDVHLYRYHDTPPDDCTNDINIQWRG